MRLNRDTFFTFFNHHDFKKEHVLNFSELYYMLAPWIYLLSTGYVDIFLFI